MSREIGARMPSAGRMRAGGRGRAPRARRRAGLGVALAAICGALVGAAPAQAGVQQEYKVFSDCPLSAIDREAHCIVSTVTSGEFVIGSKAVPINRTVTLQGGLEGTTLVPAADGNTLSKTPLQLPGGLAGIELLPPLTEVTATAELAGPVSVSIPNTLAATGTAVSLPLTVKLDNPVLGGSCVIGSASEPIHLNLTTGTTSPPPPNQPISGNVGTLNTTAGAGGISTLEGNSLVDNAFAAPGVNGCGALPLLIDPLVDIDAGLPAAAGHNTAIMNGTVLVTEARLVAAEAALPELGHCALAPFDKVERENHYHGGYVNSNCTRESRGGKFGEFEWFAGPRAKPKFSVAEGVTTLETASKRKLTCSKATGSGETTGAKTSTLTLKLVSCKLPASKEICQSAGAAAGEIVAGPLDGQLAFIEDQFKEGIATTLVGLDVSGRPSLLTAECGPQKVPLSVTGSAIGQLTPIDEMSKSFVLQFSRAAGAQVPESFEEDPTRHSLSLSLGSGAAEAAGLSAKAKLINEEKMEIKAEV